MKNIIETTKKLIDNKGDFVTFEEIIEVIENDQYNPQEIQAVIYSDLITDGRFFLEKGQWNLKNSFTMNEINKIRSQEMVDSIDDTTYEEEIIEENEFFENIEEDEIDVEEIIEERASFEEIDG